MLNRFVCWLLGHVPINDPDGHPFSTRNRICARCGHIPAAHA